MAQSINITEDLVTHMRAAFPPMHYKPGMSLEEVAFAQGTQEPIIRLEQLLHQRNKRGR